MEQKKQSDLAFTKENYILLIAGILLNLLGFFLMMGGKSTSYAQFNKEEIFSTVRITLAPFVIVVGYIVIMYAIMKSGHKKEKN
jgi:hypothetical protein